MARVTEINDHFSSSTSAFGDSVTTTYTPMVELTFKRGNIDTTLADTFTSGGSSSVSADTTSRCALTCDTAQYNYAVLKSRQYTPYYPGQGTRARFTAAFDTPASSTQQYVGVGNIGNGYFIGYDGSAFGVMHRYGGRQAIYTTTVSVTTPSSGPAFGFTLTIPTLTGAYTTDTITLVANDGAGTAESVAAEIASLLRANAGFDARFVVEASGADVVIMVRGAGSAVGSPGSAVITGSGVTLGTLTEREPGAYATETWVSQRVWNGKYAKLFTNNTWTNGNVFQIVFQWLGYGIARFYVEDPDTGELRNVHTIKWPGSSKSLSVEDPDFQYEATVYNRYSAGSSTKTMYVGSVSVGTEGDNYNRGPLYSITSEKASIGSSGKTLLILRNRWVAPAYTNNFDVITPMVLVVSNIGGNKVATVKIIRNGTIPVTSDTDTPKWVSSLFVGSQYDVTCSTAVTGGSTIVQLVVAPGTNEMIDLRSLGVQLFKDDTLAVVMSTSGTSVEGSASLTWRQD